MIAAGTDGGTGAAAGVDAGLDGAALAGAAGVGAEADVGGFDAASAQAHPAPPAASTAVTNVISQIKLARLVMRRSIPCPGAPRALE